jgi:hypothetical protein
VTRSPFVSLSTATTSISDFPLFRPPNSRSLPSWATLPTRKVKQVGETSAKHCRVCRRISSRSPWPQFGNSARPELNDCPDEALLRRSTFSGLRSTRALHRWDWATMKWWMAWEPARAERRHDTHQAVSSLLTAIPKTVRSHHSLVFRTSRI